jgi:hypothetical protein
MLRLSPPRRCDLERVWPCDKSLWRYVDFANGSLIKIILIIAKRQVAWRAEFTNLNRVAN